MIHSEKVTTLSSNYPSFKLANLGLDMIMFNFVLKIIESDFRIDLNSDFWIFNKWNRWFKFNYETIRVWFNSVRFNLTNDVFILTNYKIT